MAWTQNDLDALDKAIGKGVLRVAYLSGSVEYQSLDAMLKLRKIMQTEVLGNATPQTTVGAYCSGTSGAQLYPSRGRRW